MIPSHFMAVVNHSMMLIMEIEVEARERSPIDTPPINVDDNSADRKEA
jgi:hypothetical protein